MSARASIVYKSAVTHTFPLKNGYYETLFKEGNLRDQELCDCVVSMSEERNTPEGIPAFFAKTHNSGSVMKPFISVLCGSPESYFMSSLCLPERKKLTSIPSRTTR